MKYYIYKLINKKNNDVIYIRYHKYKTIDDDYYGSGSFLKYFKRKLKIIWKKLIYKEIICYGIENEDDACFLEKTYIKKYRDINQAILNYQDGGKTGKHPNKREKAVLFEKIDKYIIESVL